jgi:leucyl aminopeptidase (aminopeptidase T)
MSRLTDAARLVLRDCLQVGEEENVLFLFDSYGQSLAESFLEASTEAIPTGLNARYVSIDYQIWYTERQEVPKTLRMGLAESDVVITSVTDLKESTGFRAQVLELAVANRARIMHMPGVDEKIFLKAVADTNFAALHNSASALFDTLDGKSSIEIRTVSTSGTPHSLHASVDGRKWHICGGIAERGEIMNLPTGEVYAAPLEHVSRGSLVLNGSTEDAVFHGSEEVILFFEDGRLQLDKCAFAREPNSRRLKAHLQDMQRNHPAALVLGEIGFGLNPAIKRLIGSEILDEKALGTAHIALGANKPFGGAIDGDYHRDLIFVPSEVVVDGDVLPNVWKRPG